MLWQASKAILAELLPSLETVELVTIVPREKQLDGQLRLEFNEDRMSCGTFTRQYLHEQITAVCTTKLNFVIGWPIFYPKPKP